MKTIITQQEILLMTGSNFFQHQLCEKNEQDRSKSMSQNEKMEEACWNGMLDELIPGLIEKSVSGKALLLWQVRHCKSFLQIELADERAKQDYYYSVDPYLFLREGFNN